MELKRIIRQEIKRKQKLNEFEFKENDDARFIKVLEYNLKKNGVKFYSNSGQNQLVPYISGGDKIWTLKYLNDNNQAIRLNWKSNNSKNHVFSISIWYHPRLAPHQVLNVEDYTVFQLIEACTQLLKGKRKLKIRGKGKVTADVFNPKRGRQDADAEFDDLKAKFKPQNQPAFLNVVPETAPKEKLAIDMPFTNNDLFADLTSEEIFQQMEDYLEIIKTGAGGKKSLVITGDPGIGKTFGVLKALKGTDFIHQKGSITSEQNLYRLLYSNNDPNRIIVFDDLDTILTNKEMANILKGALDSTEGQVAFISNSTVHPLLYKFYREFESLSRDEVEVWIDKLHKHKIYISDLDIYGTDKNGEEFLKKSFINNMSRAKNPFADNAIFPRYFTFIGKIIFISNLYLNAIPKALLSRCLTIEIDLTLEQILERIFSVLEFIDIPGATHEQKLEVYEFFRDEVAPTGFINKLDFRTFSDAVVILMSGSPKWKRYVATALKNSTSLVKNTIKR